MKFWIVVLSCLLAYGIHFLIKTIFPNFQYDRLLSIPSAPSIYIGTIWLFEHCLWKSTFVRKLLRIKTPDLSWKRTWDWKSSFKNTKFNVQLELYQTYSNIKIKWKFWKSYSDSNLSIIQTNEFDTRVLYTYSNKTSFGSVKWMNDHGWVCDLVYELTKKWTQQLNWTYYNSKERANNWSFLVKKVKLN